MAFSRGLGGYVAALVLLIAPCRADPITVSELLALCSGAPMDVMCLGYTMGVSESLAATEIGAGFCLPKSTTNNQVTDAITGFLRAHVELWTKPAVVASRYALMQTYPCQPKSALPPGFKEWADEPPKK